MPELTMKIAGQTGRVQIQFESTAAYCRNYLTGDTPDFSACVTQNARQYIQYCLRFSF